MFRQSLSVLCASTGRSGRLSALSAPAVTQALQSLPGWHTDGNAINTIRRDFVFRDFGEAMNFMVRVAPFCDANDHHPNWMNVYNRVGVRLTTHDLGNKVSQKDVDLARHMNDIYSGMLEANRGQK